MDSICFHLAYLEPEGQAVSLCHNHNTCTCTRNKGLVPFYVKGLNLHPMDSMLDILAKSLAFVLHEVYVVNVVI